MKVLGIDADQIKCRNIILDIYKGLLIVFVVLRHVLQYSVSDEGGPDQPYLGSADAGVYDGVRLFFCQRS